MAGGALTEEWRDIPGYEGRYQASSEGRVRSVDWVLADGRLLRGKVLKGSPVGKTGHLAVSLRALSRRYVHHLVAEAFVGPRPPGLVAKHVDGQHLNNRPGNIEYGTQASNVEDRYRHAGRGKVLTEEAVRDIRLLLSSGWTKAALSRRYAVPRTSVQGIASGRLFRWVK